MHLLTRSFVTLAAAIAASCGGGDDGTGAAPAVQQDSTRIALQTTNLSSVGFPWNGSAAGILKTWDLPIPVKLNGESRATAAIDEIERRVGRVLFDRNSIANLADDQISRGPIVSVGTAFVAPGVPVADACGGVAIGPNTGSWPSPASAANGVMSHRLYVQLDGPVCRASIDIAIHEFGHAIGMGAHFQGFGEGGPISPLFWTVLRTIVSNPPGTAAAALVVP